MSPDIEGVFMPTIQLNGSDLLEAVRKMAPEEFDAFLEQALSTRRNRPRTATLSAKESKLIKRINRGIPDELSRRYARLSQKRSRRALTSAEHTELLKLTHQVETLDAERAAALLELAKLRRVPVRLLMKHLGIKAAPLHG
jgi:hypothetical protein